jgi:hypothetical protein
MRWCGLRKSPNQGNKARCGADVVRFSGRSANHTSESGTADGAVSGGFLGSLTGLIFLNAAAGAASGALTDVGINEHFMKELSATLSPRQFNPVRAAKKSHAGQGQGTGRTEGNRRENLEVAGTGATVAASVLKLGDTERNRTPGRCVPAADREQRFRFDRYRLAGTLPTP